MSSLVYNFKVKNAIDNIHGDKFEHSLFATGIYVPNELFSTIKEYLCDLKLIEK